jgi:hypothetical protein
MGNQLSAQPLKQSASPGDVLAEVPQVTYKATLGGGRFLKTVRCVHDDGGELVVKVTHGVLPRGNLSLGFGDPRVCTKHQGWAELAFTRGSSQQNQAPGPRTPFTYA